MNMSGTVENHIPNGQPAQTQLLQERYQSVLTRIEQSCVAANRERTAAKLLAVSKTFPAQAVLDLADLGQRAFGENYVQEAVEKIIACRQAGRNLEWHFIGPIQSNKTRLIAEHFDCVHSVERLKIAQRLAEQRPAELAPLRVYIQVNISGETSKSGCQPSELIGLCKAVLGLPRIELVGLMAIPEAPSEHTAPTANAAPQLEPFLRLANLLIEARAALTHENGAEKMTELSMGMSADLEAAIRSGSTVVRVGSALFGQR
jgi:PLP dependent protein